MCEKGTMWRSFRTLQRCSSLWHKLPWKIPRSGIYPLFSNQPKAFLVFKHSLGINTPLLWRKCAIILFHCIWQDQKTKWGRFGPKITLAIVMIKKVCLAKYRMWSLLRSEGKSANNNAFRCKLGYFTKPLNGTEQQTSVPRPTDPSYITFHSWWLPRLRNEQIQIENTIEIQNGFSIYDLV